MSGVRRVLLAPFRVVYDFLVDETPGIFVCVVATVLVATALRHHRALAYLALCAIPVCAFAASTWHGRRRAT